MTRPADEPTLWFVIRSGQYAGRVHLRGWYLSAIYQGDPLALANENPYFGWAGCPRCFAMVPNNGDPDRETVSSQMWGHERWHATTDYPIPPEVTVAAAKRQIELAAEARR